MHTDLKGSLAPIPSSRHCQSPLVAVHPQREGAGIVISLGVNRTALPASNFRLLGLPIAAIINENFKRAFYTEIFEFNTIFLFVFLLSCRLRGLVLNCPLNQCKIFTEASKSKRGLERMIFNKVCMDNI